MHTCQGGEYINRIGEFVLGRSADSGIKSQVRTERQEDGDDGEDAAQSILDLATSGNALIAETEELLAQGAESSLRLQRKRGRRRQRRKGSQAMNQTRPQRNARPVFLSGLFLCLGLIGGAKESHVSHLTVEEFQEQKGRRRSRRGSVSNPRNDNDIALAEAVRKSLLSCFVDDKSSALEMMEKTSALVRLHCVGAVLAFLTRSHELCVPGRPEEEIETCLINAVILQRLAGVEDDILLSYMCIDEVIVSCQRRQRTRRRRRSRRLSCPPCSYISISISVSSPTDPPSTGLSHRRHPQELHSLRLQWRACWARR